MDPTPKDSKNPPKKECSKAYAKVRGEQVVKDAIDGQLHQNYLIGVAKGAQAMRLQGKKIDPTEEFCSTVNGHLDGLSKKTNNVLDALEIDAECSGKSADFPLFKKATESIVKQTQDAVKPVVQACEFKFTS